MNYDIGKGKEEYLGSVRDFGHRRLAKKMVDAKRAAKVAPMNEPMEEGEIEAGGEGMEEAAPEMAESHEEPSDAGGKIEVSVTPRVTVCTLAPAVPANERLITVAPTATMATSFFRFTASPL